MMLENYIKFPKFVEAYNEAHKSGEEIYTKVVQQ